MQNGIIMVPWQGDCLGGDKKTKDLSQTLRVLQSNSLSRLGLSQNKDKTKGSPQINFLAKVGKI